MGIEDEEFTEAELQNDKLKELQKKLTPEPTFKETLDTVLVVDNLPKIGQDKVAKLKTVIEKIYNGCGKIVKDGLYLPVDKSGNTLGFAFIEFSSPEEVGVALERTNQYKLDKNHILAVNRWSDFDRLAKVSEEFNAPPAKEYVPRENLRWWLSDKREQYVVLYANETELYWHEPIKPQPTLIYRKTNWTDRFLQWSPHGSYLTTIHQRGIMLWGGKGWTTINKFSHTNLDSVDFSPNENYLITSLLPEKTKETEKEFIIVWDIVTGKKLRGFEKGAPFKWSFDDKYFARQSTDKLSIFEAPSMGLLEKKSLNIPRITSFEWSPSKHYIAIYVAEDKNNPAYISVIEVPSKTEVYRKALFNVVNCTLAWQSEGRYLCAQINRNKTKKTIVTTFEIYNFEAKTVTTEILTMPDNVRVFSWEPKGKKFAVIHGEENSIKVKVSFYQVTKKGILNKCTLENKTAKHLFWSPRGNFLVIGGGNGSLEFFNAVLYETMAESEHYMVTDLQWDPTGRYVCTFVTAWKHQMENGYVIHTFKGDVVRKVLKDQFYQFLWRPRPPSLLSEQQEQEIKQNLTVYAAKYKTEDQGLLGVIFDEKYKEQQRLLHHYKETMKQYRETYESQRAERAKLRGGVFSDDESQYEIIETEVEEVVEEFEEIF